MPIILKEDSNPGPGTTGSRVSIALNQRRRMLMALALLLVAFIVLLVEDSEIWFGPKPANEAVAAEPSAPQPVTSVMPQATTPSTSTITLTPPPQTGPPRDKKTVAKAKAVAPAPPQEQASSEAGAVITATNRTVLPPLQVEVVAGNQHRALPPSNNSVKVEMQSSSPEASVSSTAEQTADSSPAASTTTQVTMPPATAQRVTRSVEPSYPTLARQMKVQGAVVLQVLIDKAGKIEDLHVISGPSILASAAQQAVRQWHFKPYYQDKQPVETEARVTVNFTISTY